MKIELMTYCVFKNLNKKKIIFFYYSILYFLGFPSMILSL
jgi:hypothetical protein